MPAPLGDCATATRQQTDAALVELLRAIEAAEPAMAWAMRSGRSLTAADRHSGQHISLQQSAQGQRDPNPVREIAYVRIIKIAARNGDVRRWIVP
jgi:hypothetical protein